MLSLQHVQPGVLNGSASRHVVPWKLSRTVRCASCDITLNSHQQAEQHYGGKAHQRRLQKLQHHQQQQQKELRPSDTQIETPATEGPKQDAAVAERKSSAVDDVASEKTETDTASITVTQDSAGEFTSVYGHVVCFTHHACPHILLQSVPL